MQSECVRKRLHMREVGEMEQHEHHPEDQT